MTSIPTPDDTHTAVAVKVYKDYAAATGDKTKTVIASTASHISSQAQFLQLSVRIQTLTSSVLLTSLPRFQKIPVPASLAALKDKEVRFTKGDRQG